MEQASTVREWDKFVNRNVFDGVSIARFIKESETFVGQDVVAVCQNME